MAKMLHKRKCSHVLVEKRKHGSKKYGYFVYPKIGSQTLTDKLFHLTTI